MKLSILGTGYVGLSSALSFVELGHKVICYDIDRVKIEKLKKAISPIFETDLEKLLKKHLKIKNISFETDIKKSIENSDIIFCCTGSPIKNGKVDISSIVQSAKNFGKYINSSKIFVNKSTVPVGETKKLKKIIENEIKNRKVKIKFDIASNPEFLREGTAIFDTLNPDRLIIGVENDETFQKIKEIYKPLAKKKKPIIKTSLESAELIKYASNVFLATKISFINEVANFCELAGANIKDVAKGIGLDKRIGDKFLNAGIGFGGSCLPKDIEGLINIGKIKKFDFKILKAVKQVNENQQGVLIEKLKNKFKNLEGKTIAILGLSFKANTDDLRDAPSLQIIQKLINLKAKIRVYDPVSMKKFFKTPTLNERGLGGIFAAKTPADCLKSSDACLILTEWDEFKKLKPKDFEKSMKGNLLLDGRNIFDKKDFEKSKIDYYGIGQN